MFTGEIPRQNHNDQWTDTKTMKDGNVILAAKRRVKVGGRG
jgi:hypothetical protein